MKSFSHTRATKNLVTTALVLLLNYVVANTVRQGVDNARHWGSTDGRRHTTSTSTSTSIPIVNASPFRIRNYLSSATASATTAFWGDDNDDSRVIVENEEQAKNSLRVDRLLRRRQLDDIVTAHSKIVKNNNVGRLRRLLSSNDPSGQLFNTHMDTTHDNVSGDPSSPELLSSNDPSRQLYNTHMDTTQDNISGDPSSPQLQFTTTDNISRILNDEDDFVAVCTGQLLIEQNFDDNLISDVEFVTFISDYCVKFGICNNGDPITDFHQLNAVVQKEFIFFLCPQGDDRKQCFDRVIEKDNANQLFGFEIVNDDRTQVESDVNDFCSWLYGFIFPPTQPPKEEPTQAPKPSAKPTKAIKRIAPSDPDPEDTITPFDGGNTDRDKFAQATGIAVAGGLLLFLAIYAVGRTKCKDKEEISSSLDGSYTDDVANDNRELGYGDAVSTRAGLMGLHGIKEEEDEEDDISYEGQPGVLQFDPNSITSNTTMNFFPVTQDADFISLSGSSSGDELLSLDDEVDAHVRLDAEMDAAMDAGDWAAVAALASDISIARSDGEGSSLASSQNSRRERLSDNGSMTGITFDDDMDAVETDVSSVESGSWTDNPIINTISSIFSSAEPSPPQNDRVTHSDLPTQQVRTDRPSSVTSSLSNASPVRNGNLTDFEPLGGAGIGVGATIGAFAAFPPPCSDSSSGSDDDKKPMLSSNDTKTASNNEQHTRTWKDKMLFRKKEGKKEPSELALQEDSSGASSWSHSSDEENVLVDPYGDGGNVHQSPMQGEIEAFGSGYGLVAAEKSFQAEGSSSVDSDNLASEESRDSLRDGLDRAIESGDWAALERQTNNMLEIPSEEMLGITAVTSSGTFNDDTVSQGGWSTGEDEDSNRTSASPVDNERIRTLERLIETDDWQGIVTPSRIHNINEDSTMASASTCELHDATLASNSSMGEFHDTEETSADLIAQDEIWKSITRKADGGKTNGNESTFV